MSQKAKVIKDKKKFPWGKIWDFLKSLVSNAKATEYGKTKKWYWSVPLFILAIGLAMIPQTVSAGTTSGAQFVSSTNNDSYYLGLEDYADNGVDDITFSDGKANTTFAKSVTTPLHTYSSATDAYTLRIFFAPDGTDLNTAITKINEIPLPSDPSVLITGSYMVFTTNNFFGSVYANGKLSSSVTGDYTKLRDEIKNAGSLKSLLMLNVTASMNHIERRNTILNNFKDFSYDIYLNNRIINTWIMTGIILGINAGITLVMGLILFLMTRGKNNPNRELKWYQFFGIAFWIAPVPGLLSMILGFIIPAYAIMFYVVTYGVRAVFLSMKQLKPIAN